MADTLGRLFLILRFLTSVFACMSVFQQLGKTRYDAHVIPIHSPSSEARIVSRAGIPPSSMRFASCDPSKTRKNDGSPF